MSRYLDFVTFPLTARLRFTNGEPVHDGIMPTRGVRFKGIRVDQEPVDFRDESLPERILKALVEGAALERRGFLFDCLLFTALMDEAELDTSDCDSRPFMHWFGTPILDLDAEIGRPLFLLRNDLGEGSPLLDGADYHAVYPAATVTKPLVVHKLGRTELCLSGLSAAAEMYGTDMARVLSF